MKRKNEQQLSGATAPPGSRRRSSSSLGAKKSRSSASQEQRPVDERDDLYLNISALHGYCTKKEAHCTKIRTIGLPSPGCWHWFSSSTWDPGLWSGRKREVKPLQSSVFTLQSSLQPEPSVLALRLHMQINCHLCSVNLHSCSDCLVGIAE